MRLRYLHLPQYGPLVDLRLVFDQSEFTKGDYALNFVAGVNATGKSSLMRAIFETLRALDNAEGLVGTDRPPFPVDIAYEIDANDQTQTVIFQKAPNKDITPCVFVCRGRQALALPTEWDALVERLRASQAPPHPWDRYEIDDNYLDMILPKRVVAYTSGAREPWLELQRRVLQRDDLPEHQVSPSTYEERPVNWSARRELESAYADWREPPMAPETALEWQMIVRTAPPPASDRVLLVDPFDLKIAGLTLCLSETAADFAKYKTATERRNYATELRKHLNGEEDNKTARWLLKQAGVLWPTHLAFTLNPNRRNLPGDTAAKLFALYGLADHVMSLPLGRELVIVALGKQPTRPLDEILHDALGEGATLPGIVKDVVSAVGTPSSNAEALLRLFGEREGADSLYPTFRTLHLWADYCLLEDVTATFRRVRNDDVVTYESLSDGEQMILGRMALLFLLKNQHGSLLLMDEPETHFNDLWKRQIVDVLHDNLRDTNAHVLISTHSSIALSDAFSKEIVRLVPGEHSPQSHPVAFPTFGTEPGRIMVNVFDAPDSIGSRALEMLHEFLKNPPEDKQTLEKLVAAIGGGWPRAKLREILEKLDATPSN